MYTYFREKFFWHFILLFASGFVIIALLFDYFFFEKEPELIYFFRIGDLFACLIFFVDFILSLKEQKHKKNFWRLACLDLFASIPNLASWGLKYFAWFFYLCALIRIARSTLRLVTYLFLEKDKALMSIASTLLFSSIFISSLLILEMERNFDNANIRTLEESIWWAISTVTTVGYGDFYPVSLNGRIVAVFLMFVGITLFSMLAALVLSWLLTSIARNEEDTSHEEISKTVKDIKELINKKLP